MKKVLIAVTLVAGITVAAFASLNNKTKKVDTDKKVEKKSCSHKCLFSS